MMRFAPDDDTRLFTWTDNDIINDNSLRCNCLNADAANIKVLYADDIRYENDATDTYKDEIEKLKSAVKQLKNDVYGDIGPRIESVVSRLETSIEALQSKDSRDPYENGEYRKMRDTEWA